MLTSKPTRTATPKRNKQNHLFEELVLKQLLARGYQVQTQYPVGYYRIDLVVMGENSRLASRV
jgi:very-short-patch-repair endonuclease